MPRLSALVRPRVPHAHPRPQLGTHPCSSPSPLPPLVDRVAVEGSGESIQIVHRDSETILDHRRWDIVRVLCDEAGTERTRADDLVDVNVVSCVEGPETGDNPVFAYASLTRSTVTRFI